MFKLILILIILLLSFTQIGYAAVSLPTSTTLPATNITTRSATLNGLVNPNGLSTSVFFYLRMGDTWYSANPLYIGSGTLPIAVNYTWIYLSYNTTYSYYIYATNSIGGNKGSENYFTTRNFPTPTITYPTNGQTFTSNTITLSGTVPGDVSLKKVEVRIGGAWSSSGWGPGDGSKWLWSTKVTLSPGSNTIYVSATDTFGNIDGSSVTVNYIDTILPTISISSPTSSQTFNTNTITVSGAASDNVAVNKVEVKVSEGTWQIAKGTNSWSAQVTLSPGSNTIYAKVIDTSGNIAEHSVPVNYIPSDPILPTISISSPTSSQTFNTSTVTVSGAASDNVAVNKVEVKLSEGTWQIARGTNSWSAQVTLSPGSNTIYAKVIDTSGNIAESSITVTYNPPEQWPDSNWWKRLIPAVILISILITIAFYVWIKGNLKLVPLQTAIQCDGKSTLPIKVQFVNIFGKLRKQKKDREIVMETSAGKIQNVVIPAGKDSTEATLTSSNECGLVTITAKSGRQKATARVNFVCKETCFDVEVSPEEIPADGKSTATVTIKMKDETGACIAYLDERTVDMTTTLGAITTPVKMPPRSLSGTAVLTSGQISGTAIVTASTGTVRGEGKAVFTELPKRYCNHCGTSMAMEAPSCPKCGKIPPSDVDTKDCRTCKAVIPLTAKYCDSCGAMQ